MREIKYRGKRIDNKEWIYGDLVHKAYDSSGRIILVGIAEHGCYPIAVDLETVGEYINHKDKTGKEIFEGDKVILRGRGKPRIIEYIDTAFRLKIADTVRDIDSVVGFYSPDEYEIIGNRHDNPELTEAK